MILQKVILKPLEDFGPERKTKTLLLALQHNPEEHKSRKLTQQKKDKKDSRKKLFKKIETSIHIGKSELLQDSN